MRFKLFLICISVIILSLICGFGLRVALAAWQEPTAAPPGDNVPGPINVGSTDQTKAGGLTIGGIFTVLGNGAVIGNPTDGAMGVGALNAERLCINGVCRDSWMVVTDAFVQGGNSFGELAILGTNDAFDLAFETAGTEKMRLDTAGNLGIGTTSPNAKLHMQIGSGSGAAPDAGTNFIIDSSGIPAINMLSPNTYYSNIAFGDPEDADVGRIQYYHTDDSMRFLTSGSERVRIQSNGNVGIGTTSPAYKLVVAGFEPRAYIWPSDGGNPELDFGNVAGDNHWAIYRDIASDQLRFWRTDNRMVITSDGNVGIGTTTPVRALEVITSAPNEWATRIYNSTTTNAYGLVVIAGESADNTQVLSAQDRMGSTLFTVKSAGSVGVGTSTPGTNGAKFEVNGDAARVYLNAPSGNPELDLGDGTNHWAIYRDTATDQLRFWRNNDNLTITSDGDVNSRRCFGPVYAGQTASTYTGDLNGAANVGYDDANALCDASISGSHVCTTAEVFETIKCNQPLLPVTGQAWISNGPPGYTARANDCTGWTSTSPSPFDGSTVYGAIWAFDASGGVGWVTTCNMSLNFACCL